VTASVGRLDPDADVYPPVSGIEKLLRSAMNSE
jgi:hypothetical protein